MVLKLIMFNIFSIGLQADPLIWGASFRIGKTEGIRLNVITGYYFTYTPIDSAKYTSSNTIYSKIFSRPEYNFSIGVRGGYFFKNLNGIQPYSSFGIEYYYKRGWVSTSKIKNDTLSLIPKKDTAYYLGLILSIGIEIYPLDVFSNMLKFEKNKTKIISFDFEINAYYKPIKKFGEYKYWYISSIGGINIGGGIRINF